MALILLFTRLGVWQLQRADAARALDTAIATQARKAPIVLDAVGMARSDPADFLWRPVSAHGRWQGHSQVLLDNQVVASLAGYFVYTPLRIDGCDCAVLVNRGWISIGANRLSVPDVGLATAAVTLRGTAAPPPSSGISIGTGPEIADMLAPGLLRVQGLDIASLSQWLGLRLLPLTIRLDPGEPEGYMRNWTLPPGRAGQHSAYAAQWFLLGVLVSVLLVGLNTRMRSTAE